jgi:hypothetical protein
VICLKFTRHAAVQPRVADVADRHLVVVEQSHHQRRAHAGILRLALRRLIDGAIDLAISASGRPGPGLAGRIMLLGSRFAKAFSSSVPSIAVAMPLATSPAL